jgi:hypothetical protein
MNTALGNIASENPSPGRRKSWLLALVFLLNVFSSFSFNRFMGAAAYYSARIPVTAVTPADEALQVTHAQRSGDRFFLLFTALILLATALLGQMIQVKENGSSGFRPRPRHILALVLCILAIGALVHVFFIYSAAAAALVAPLMIPAIQVRMNSKGFRLVVRYLLALVLCLRPACWFGLWASFEGDNPAGAREQG